MTGVLLAEYRKLVTTKVWLWLSLLAAGLSLLVIILVAANAGSADVGDRPLESAVGGVSGFGYLIAAVMGLIGLTGEFRHLTATPTFLSVPRRGRVVGAKLVVYLVYGLLLGLVVVGLVVAVGTPWLNSKGFDISLTEETTLRVVVGSVAVVAIFGIIGVGVGALVRNQVAAVVGLVLYLFLVENILSIIPGVQKAYPYLPGGAVTALSQTADTGDQLPDGVSLLEPWQGGLLLVAYGLVFALLGSWLAVRRDVT